MIDAPLMGNKNNPKNIHAQKYAMIDRIDNLKQVIRDTIHTASLDGGDADVENAWKRHLATIESLESTFVRIRAELWRACLEDESELVLKRPTNPTKDAEKIDAFLVNADLIDHIYENCLSHSDTWAEHYPRPL